MPKIRQRKTEKAKWTSETLEKAVKLIKDGQTIRKAAKATRIPFSNLQARLQKQTYSNPSLRRHLIFTAETEKEMADKIKFLANIFHGCTAIQIRKIAFQYAEMHNINHTFNSETQMAGRDWLNAFIKRNNISVRKPEATSVNRIVAFNKTEVDIFYKLLEELMGKHKFVPKNMYNCDETGISTVQDPGKILATKGQKRVGSVTSWERGKNITVLCAMNASGGFTPPMFIYPRKRMTPLLEKNGPAGALYKCSDNGWINENLFVEWLEHFTSHTKPTLAEPILLILDNHSSHISLRAYEHCKKNHIVMLSLPPDTSYRMQPLDLTFFGPLKAAYKKECDLFMKNHLAEKITSYDVASLFHKAFSIVASISKGESGFKAAGIFPLNPNIFSGEDFIPAEVLQSDPSVVGISTDSFKEVSTACTPVPSTSQDVRDLFSLPTTPQSSKARKSRQKQHAAILTSTPIKERLVDKENKKMVKNETEKKTRKGKGKRTATARTDIEKSKRKVFQDVNKTYESDVNFSNLCADDGDYRTEDSGRCSICNEFGKDNEMWYRCTSCGLWGHSLCSGWESTTDYKCDNCISS